MTQPSPTTADQWNALAAALERQGRFADAGNAYLQSLAVEPRSDTLLSLGNLSFNQGKMPEAIAAYQRALALRPDFVEAINNLGFALRNIGKASEAIVVLRRALALRPDHIDALINLGLCLAEADELDEGASLFRRVLALQPDSLKALVNLGFVYQSMGLLDEAIECYRRVAKIAPESPGAQNLLFVIHFHPAYGPKEIREEHERWYEQIMRGQTFLSAAQKNRRNSGMPRKLRIGYVSPDFYQHPVGMLFLPVIEHHNRGEFEIFCYSNVQREDALTARTKKSADVWRDIATRSDQQVADLIRADKIDILVDLALHLSHNRLMVFAQKPAPVQVTWLGYPSTTGLKTIDYRLSDPYLDPPNEADIFYTEQTVHLPHSFWCFDPINHGVEVGELPALTNGFITFGCLNNFLKVTPPTLALWAKVMRSIPRSRLILLAPRGNTRSRVQQTMSDHGIDSSRIEFADRLPREQYLAKYGEFDLCLDTIPYPGHTTTLDALWMGVPVISLRRETCVSQGGFSILSNVGHREWVAKSEEEYASITITLASDPAKLKSIRDSLRRQLQESPIMNATQFARDLESEYRQMWRRWCEQRSGASA